jgi:hypothetical protein
MIREDLDSRTDGEHHEKHVENAVPSASLTKMSLGSTSSLIAAFRPGHLCFVVLDFDRKRAGRREW